MTYTNIQISIQEYVATEVTIMADPALRCNPSLYHYNGFCFNKGRVPPGQIAIPARECEALEQKEVVTTIIS